MVALNSTLRTAPAVSPEARRVAWAVVAGVVAPVLDTTIATIALHTLTQDLRTTVSTTQWVGTGYLLAFAVGVPLAGWAATRFGTRRAWVTGLALFLLASVLCATAWNIGVLIAFRLAQGLASGLILPLMTSILTAASDGRGLGQLVAMVGVPAAVAPVLAPVLGGLLITWLDWRWLFLINVPVCAVALALSRRVPDDRDATRPRLDRVGLVLLAPALVLVLLGLSNAAGAGPARLDVVVPVAAGLALLAGFSTWSARTTGPRLIDVTVLRRRSVSSSSAVLFVSGAVTFAAMLVLPLYFQQARGLSVLGAAMLLIPQGVGALLTRGVAGRVTDAVGARFVAAAGFAVVALGTIPFALAGDSTNLWWLGVALFVRGLGLGGILTPVMAAAFVGVPQQERHDTSMLTRIAQQLGGSVGTAVLAALVTGAALGGFRLAFGVAAAVSVAGAVLSFRLPRAARPD